MHRLAELDVDDADDLMSGGGGGGGGVVVSAADGGGGGGSIDGVELGLVSASDVESALRVVKSSTGDAKHAAKYVKWGDSFGSGYADDVTDATSRSAHADEDAAHGGGGGGGSGDAHDEHEQYVEAQQMSGGNRAPIISI
jgi:hypothetical protein